MRHTRRMADLGYDADFLDILWPPPWRGATDTALRPPSRLRPLHPPHASGPPPRVVGRLEHRRAEAISERVHQSVRREFRLDPRIPAAEQTGEEAYADNDLDRGHIARRSDLLWGTLTEARQANTDSFYFTNITPQHG